MNCFDIPVLINVRDRLGDLQALITWLEHAGYQNIRLLDNASTWPPLLAYLKATPHQVIALNHNYGSRAPWLTNTIPPNQQFVYTDCDVLPTEDCPSNLVAHLQDLLARHPEYTKAGPSLKTDDVPSTMPSLEWETGPEINGYILDNTGACNSLIDTTFALYRPNTQFELQAIRADAPYEVRHMPWYRPTLTDLSDDERYYLAHANRGPEGTTSWEVQAA